MFGFQLRKILDSMIQTRRFAKIACLRLRHLVAGPASRLAKPNRGSTGPFREERGSLAYLDVVRGCHDMRLVIATADVPEASLAGE